MARKPVKILLELMVNNDGHLVNTLNGKITNDFEVIGTKIVHCSYGGEKIKNPSDRKLEQAIAYRVIEEETFFGGLNGFKKIELYIQRNYP